MAGRVTRSVQPEADERFWWDAADNRTTAERQPVWNNMLRRRDTHRYVTQRYSYDDEDRISAVDIEGDRQYARAEYRYDVLGRRTEKRVWRHGVRVVGDADGGRGERNIIIHGQTVLNSFAH